MDREHYLGRRWGMKLGEVGGGEWGVRRVAQGRLWEMARSVEDGEEDTDERWPSRPHISHDMRSRGICHVVTSVALVILSRHE